MNQLYEPEEHAIDALLVALFHGPRAMQPLTDFAPLTDADLALLDAVPANLVETLWAEEARPKPAPVGGGRGSSALSFRSVFGAISLVALLFYGTFIALAWNIRPDIAAWHALRSLTGRQVPDVTDEIPAADVRHVATVTGADNCLWTAIAEPLPEHLTGANLPAQRPLGLKSGCVEMTLAGGVRVAIEGPAQFELRSAQRLALQAGRLMAQVPPAAIGFTVETPHAEIVDLGTEFTVEVEPDGLARVAVLEGKVNVQASLGRQAGQATITPLLLTAGSSVEIASASASGIRSIPYQPATFTKAVLGTAPPTNPNSFKDGYRIVAWYRGQVPAGPAASPAEALQVSAHPDAYFQTPLQGAGSVRREAAMGGRVLRFAAGGEPALLTTAGMPSLGDHFVLEADLLPEVVCESPVVYYGDMAHNGVGIAVRLGQWSVMLGGVGVLHSGIPCEPGKWTHVAVVLEKGSVSMLVDGRQAEGPWQIRGRTSDGSLTVGGHPGIDRRFVGLVSNVRLLDLQYKFDPHMLLPGAATTTNFTPLDEANLKHRGTENAEELSQ